MNKKELQKIIDDMKKPLAEYWTNDVRLPLSIQLHSMALMDLFIHELEITIEESIDFLLNHPDLKIGKVDPRLKSD